MFPPRTYKTHGWVDWGDWLGSGTLSSKRAYRPFKDARAFARGLGLRNRSQWNEYFKSGKLPIDIPLRPERVYKNCGYKNLADWLNSRNVRGGYLKYQDAKKFAQSLNFVSKEDWINWAKTEARPTNIPAAPQNIYKDDGWVDYSDWLGSTRVRGNMLPFKEARTYARALNLRSRNQWNQWAVSRKRPLRIPTHPEATYVEEGWIDYSDWLGTPIFKSEKKEYRDYEQARDFVHSLNLANVKEWNAWKKLAGKPPDIPSKPDRIYKEEGWSDWGNWLGTNRTPRNQFREFGKAREFARSLKLRNMNDWQRWAATSDRPKDIPKAPDSSYKNKGWIGWPDWLIGKDP
jgi:hypothetical protein